MFVECKNVKKTYGEKDNQVEVLKGVDLEIEEGKICTILGPSGSGKSTLLNIIGGLDKANGGSVVIDGVDLASLNFAELTEYRRNYLGFIFQFYNLIPDLTVRENIGTTKYLSKDSMDTDELLKLLGLEEHSGKFPSQLSGGQQQRCAIGRALVKNPKLLLCDEPTGALDSKTSGDILELLEELNKKFHTTIIMVTHNNDIAKMSDQIVEVRDGKIVKNYENKNKLSAKEVSEYVV